MNALAPVSLCNLILYLLMPFSLHPSHTGLSSGPLTHLALLCHETFLHAIPSACNTLFQLIVSLLIFTFHFGLNDTYLENFL